MKKKCNCCKREKSLSEYHLYARSKDGHYAMCKTCRSTKEKGLYGRTPEQVRRGNLKKIGWTLEDYDIAFEKQNGRCALCWQPETILYKGVVRRLSADHNHKTGEKRKLLCTKCNAVLGSVHEDVSLLQKMIEYLTT